MTTKRRGVLYVHGQGDGRRPGQEFAKLLNGIVHGLKAAQAGNSPLVHDFTLGVNLDDRGDDGIATPFAKLHVHHAGGDDLYLMREAYWEDAHPAPGAEQVVRWVLFRLGAAIDGVLAGWWDEPTAGASPARRRWSRATAANWLYRVVLLVLTGALVPVILLMALLRPLAWLLYAASKTPVLSSFGVMARISRGFDGLNVFMSRTLGDSQTIVSDEAWSRNIRRRIEGRADELIDAGIEELLIVGYSAGATPAYDALLEGRPLPEKLVEKNVQVRFLTLGSSINPLWSWARADQSGLPQRVGIARKQIDPRLLERWQTSKPPRLPFWTDVFARFDLVPGGELKEEIGECAGVLPGSRSPNIKDAFEGRRVINYDNLADDHGGYFANQEQFVPRLLALMSGNEAWQARLNPVRRAQAVLWLNAMKLLPVVLIPAHILATATIPWWASQVDRAGGFIVRLPGQPFGGIASWTATTPEVAAFTVVFSLATMLVARAAYGWWKPYIDHCVVIFPDYLGKQVVRGLRSIRPLASVARWLRSLWAWGGNGARGGRLVGYLLLSPLLAVLVAIVAAAVGAGIDAGFSTLWRWLSVAAVAVVLSLAIWGVVALDELRRPDWGFWRVTFRAVTTGTFLTAFLLGIPWFGLNAQIHQGALRVPAVRGLNVTVERVEDDTVFLRRSGAAERPGVVGLRWGGGYAQLGSPEEAGLLVRRQLLEPSIGSPPPPGEGRIETAAFANDPLLAYEPGRRPGVSVEPVSYTTVTYVDLDNQPAEAPLPAWIVSEGGAGGSAANWVIMVHGKGSTRAEGLRIVPTLTEMGFTVMLIAYRNGGESPSGTDARYEYGLTEFADLEAAVRVAGARGAASVTLFGYSMGGAVVSSTLQRSNPGLAVAGVPVCAVVLDSPMLDLRDTVDFGIERTPGMNSWLARAWPNDRIRDIAGWRFGLRWDETSYVDFLAGMDRPVLFIHSVDDELTRFETTQKVVAERKLGGLETVFLRYDGVDAAAHTGGWNVDRVRYEGAVASFLGDCAA
jgi:hypothetical protein